MSNYVKGGGIELAPEEILEQLMNEYGDSLLRMCYVYLKDYQLAEDATQDTFIKAMNAYDSFQNKSTEKTWLTRIAINCCKNVMRTRWFTNRNTNMEESQIITAQNSIDEFLEKESMANAVSSLKADDKEVILLYYYQNLSIKEVAYVIKKTENATIQRLNRARGRLKKILLEVGYSG